MSKIYRAATRVNKMAVKFQLDVKIERVSLRNSIQPEDNQLTVTFTRDNKKLTTEAVKWKDDSATWHQVVGLNSTVYRNKEGGFQDKIYNFVITAIPSNQIVATFELNIAEFIGSGGENEKAMILSALTSKDPNASLSVVVRCKWKAEKSRRESSRTVSVLSDPSSRGASMALRKDGASMALRKDGASMALRKDGEIKTSRSMQRLESNSADDSRSKDDQLRRAEAFLMESQKKINSLLSELDEAKVEAENQKEKVTEFNVINIKLHQRNLLLRKALVHHDDGTGSTMLSEEDTDEEQPTMKSKNLTSEINELVRIHLVVANEIEGLAQFHGIPIDQDMKLNGGKLTMDTSSSLTDIKEEYERKLSRMEDSLQSTLSELNELKQKSNEDRPSSSFRLEALESELSHYQEENERLLLQMDTLHEQIEEFEQKQKEQEEAMATASTKDNGGGNSLLNHILQDVSREKVVLERKVEKLEKEIEHLKNEHTSNINKKEEEETFKSQLDEKDREILSLEEQIEEWKEKASKSLSNKKNDERSSEILTLEEEIEELNKEIDDLAKERDELIEKVEKMESVSSSAVQRSSSELQFQYDRLQDLTKRQETSVKSMEKKVIELESKFEQVQREKEQIEEEFTFFKSSEEAQALESASAALGKREKDSHRELRKQLQLIKQENLKLKFKSKLSDDLNEKLNHMTKEKKSIEIKLTAMEGRLEDAETRNRGNSKSHDTINLQLQTLETEKDQLMALNRKLKTKNTHLEEDTMKMTQLSRDFEQEKEKHLEFVSKCQNLKKQLREQDEKLDLKESEIKNITHQLNMVKKDVSRYQQQLKTIKEERDFHLKAFEALQKEQKGSGKGKTMAIGTSDESKKKIAVLEEEMESLEVKLNHYQSHYEDLNQEKEAWMKEKRKMIDLKDQLEAEELELNRLKRRIYELESREKQFDETEKNLRLQETAKEEMEEERMFMKNKIQSLNKALEEERHLSNRLQDELMEASEEKNLKSFSILQEEEWKHKAQKQEQELKDIQKENDQHQKSCRQLARENENLKMDQKLIVKEKQQLIADMTDLEERMEKQRKDNHQLRLTLQELEETTKEKGKGKEAIEVQTMKEQLKMYQSLDERLTTAMDLNNGLVERLEKMMKQMKNIEKEKHLLEKEINKLQRTIQAFNQDEDLDQDENEENRDSFSHTQTFDSEGNSSEGSDDEFNNSQDMEKEEEEEEEKETKKAAATNALNAASNFFSSGKKFVKNNTKSPVAKVTSTTSAAANAAKSKSSSLFSKFSKFSSNSTPKPTANESGSKEVNMNSDEDEDEDGGRPSSPINEDQWI